MSTTSTHRKPNSRQSSWCCPFTAPPLSPDQPSINKTFSTKSRSLSKPTSPQSQSSKSGLTFVGRILSPGRVSPIDSDPVEQIIQKPIPPFDSAVKSRSPSFRALPESSSSSSYVPRLDFDVRLNLKGKKSGVLVLEMNSQILKANSEVLASLIDEHRKGSGLCRIEVQEVDNLGVFREVIELMYEDDMICRLIKMGVYRTIDVLEVSAGIKFSKGILACLKYIESAPWTDEEEEKLRSLFKKFKFDDTTTKDILVRLYSQESATSEQSLARQLVWVITTSPDGNARNELKSLVKGLLCKSSVYQKDQPCPNKEDLYIICQSCLDSLVSIFKDQPLVERISREVDNINWLLEILLDWQIAEEFVIIWTNQVELLKLHETASPMVRYEVSRVSANIFIAIGTGKLHCRVEVRSKLVEAWFGPMLLDFGWLRRCKKGLDIKGFEEAMGQTLLTLPLKLQCMLFMEWARLFSKHGKECPNLSNEFQIWWRRSLVRGSETCDVDSSRQSVQLSNLFSSEM